MKVKAIDTLSTRAIELINSDKLTREKKDKVIKLIKEMKDKINPACTKDNTFREHIYGDAVFTLVCAKQSAVDEFRAEQNRRLSSDEMVELFELSEKIAPKAVKENKTTKEELLVMSERAIELQNLIESKYSRDFGYDLIIASIEGGFFKKGSLVLDSKKVNIEDIKEQISDFPKPLIDALLEKCQELFTVSESELKN
jgi:hypothetical protein